MRKYLKKRKDTTSWKKKHLQDTVRITNVSLLKAPVRCSNRDLNLKNDVNFIILLLMLLLIVLLFFSMKKSKYLGKNGRK